MQNKVVTVVSKLYCHFIGKILNVEKARLDKIIRNEEIHYDLLHLVVVLVLNLILQNVVMEKSSL